MRTEYRKSWSRLSIALARAKFMLQAACQQPEVKASGIAT